MVQIGAEVPPPAVETPVVDDVGEAVVQTEVETAVDAIEGVCNAASRSSWATDF